MSFSLRRPQHATIVAYLALGVALAGSSYAAVQVGRNTVTSKSIKNGQVKTKDLANSAVSSAKVGDGALLGADMIPGAAAATGAAAGGSFPTQPLASPSTGTDMRATTSITTAEPSRLVVIGTASPGVSCTAAGTCGITMGLYVDGAPLADSGAVVAAGASGSAGRTLSVLGISGTVQSGPHQVLLAGGFVNGSNVMSWGVGERRVAAIAVRP
jgi:hypothetical protein